MGIKQIRLFFCSKLYMGFYFMTFFPSRYMGIVSPNMPFFPSHDEAFLHWFPNKDLFHCPLHRLLFHAVLPHMMCKHCFTWYPVLPLIWFNIFALIFDREFFHLSLNRGLLWIAWHFCKTFLHCILAWHICMAYLHGIFAWHICMAYLHNIFCIAYLHGIFA